MLWRLASVKVCLLFIVITSFITVHAQDEVGLFKIHPVAASYCAKLDLSKRILVGHYLNDGFSISMPKDLSIYDQLQCRQVITELVSDKEKIVLKASPSVFSRYQKGLSARQKTFDYSFICASERVTTLILSAAKDWSVLGCLKNKDQIRSLMLSHFVAPELDLNLLTAFRKLEQLSFTQGRLNDNEALGQLLTLKSLAFHDMDINNSQYDAITGLRVLESLRFQHVHKVNLEKLVLSKNLRTLELVNIPHDGLVLSGLEKMTSLTTLNLQGSHVNDRIYEFTKQLPRLTYLNLSDNSDITTIEPVLHNKDLKHLNIAGTSVTDISSLAEHKSLLEHQFDIGYSIQYSKSNVVDLTDFYKKGGKNSESAHLLRCSPTSKAQYDAGVRCNETQRKKCKPAGQGFVEHYIKAPLCIWWHGD